MGKEMIVYIILCAASLIFIYGTLISRKLYMHIYKKYDIPKFNKNFTPSVSIFIPCKGGNNHLEENVKSFLNISYPSYRVFFIVENTNDPAYAIIDKSIKNSKCASLVVAGETTNCCQKNHNLIQGIQESQEKDDIYAFFDSDVPISDEWLRNLILPLSNEENTISTGFEWINLKSNTYGERLHAFMNSVQYCFMTFIPFKAIWGGNVAMRRKDFEELNIKEFWSKTVVDDMSLEKILLKNKKRTVYVPECMVKNNDPISKVNDAMNWFKRQSLFVKFYLRPYWLIGMISYPFMSLNMIIFPFILFYALYASNPTAIKFAIISGIFTIATCIWGYFIKYWSDDDHKKFIWFISTPLNTILATIAGLRSIFENNVNWSGIDYKVSYKGYVKKVTHNGK